jgi:hypothetical protein
VDIQLFQPIWEKFHTNGFLVQSIVSNSDSIDPIIGSGDGISIIHNQLLSKDTQELKSRIDKSSSTNSDSTDSSSNSSSSSDLKTLADRSLKSNITFGEELKNQIIKIESMSNINIVNELDWSGDSNKSSLVWKLEDLL